MFRHEKHQQVLTGFAMKSISKRNEKSYCQFITQTKAALLIFLQTLHVFLHKFNVPLITLCKHTNKCPMFPQYTFLINI